jgi:signal transduction histidine kinase/AraC-like DNA-binding protein
MSAKILVVDDEPQVERLIKQLFRRQIRKKEYEFAFAHNGKEALSILSNDEDIEMVLSDLNMPEMDGLTFLARLKELKPDMKAVIVSAYGDMKNIREAMNLGAFDFVTKPIEFEDLTATIQKTLKEAEMVRQANFAKELEVMNTKLKELDQMKSRFFTNISHELRTPLTIIKGMADQIQKNPEEWGDKGVQMIKRNSENLLNLVNQILDLRKLETGQLELHLVQDNVILYLSYILESFHSLAEQKNIQLLFESERSELVMDYDPAKLLRIFTNLLSNAIKFTPRSGTVWLKIDKQSNDLVIQVKDTGIGIPKDQLSSIFDRFYQVDTSQSRKGEGTGIGLAIVKEFVGLMEGEIWAESELNKGTTFHVALPIRQTAELKTSDGKEAISQQVKGMITKTAEAGRASFSMPSEEDLPTLLIVEDNPDVRQYLMACLEGRYDIKVAEDGRQGEEMAIADIPDIIISDVMMPGKDGFELCESLKTDQRTSHIPIILLTAKADEDSRLSGLKRGADAYLSKPFNEEELLVRIEKLLDNRRLLQQRYSTMEHLRPVEDAAIRQEDEFIVALKQAVLDNIDDENYGIPEICRDMALSRSQLHRKLKALTDKSTSHFIRSIRLQKAKELLMTTDLNVSEVAYEVGFRNPRYFSTTFSEEFGVTPNEVKK